MLSTQLSAPLHRVEIAVGKSEQTFPFSIILGVGLSSQGVQSTSFSATITVGIAVGSFGTGMVVSFLDDGGSSVLFQAEGGRTGIIDGNIVGDMSANELTSMGEATKVPRVKLTHRFRPSS